MYHLKGLQTNEREITLKELKTAAEENRVHEVFGTGTASAVMPIKNILHEGHYIQFPKSTEHHSVAMRALNEMMDIQVKLSNMK